MYPGDHSNPSPMTDGWLLLVAVRPSTAWEEYSSRMSGAGPPTDGGTRMWYAHEKSPDEPPADHVEDGARLVAAKLPVLPDGPEVSASSVVPDSVVTSACSARLVAPVWAAGRSTSALIVWPRALLVDGSGERALRQHHQAQPVGPVGAVRGTEAVVVDADPYPTTDAATVGPAEPQQYRLARPVGRGPVQHADPQRGGQRGRRVGRRRPGGPVHQDGK